jgi:RNA polymerase sigma factor (sigma-70 family)
MPAADPRPLAEIYQGRRGQLAGLAARFLPSDPALEPDDAVQEAFARVWAAWGRLGDLDADRALAYARQTVVNVARDAGRRRSVADRHQAALVPRTDVVAGAEDEALGRLIDADIAAALRTLPRRQRQAVLLRHYVGLSEADAAAALGTSTGAIKSYASRGLAAVRDQLGVRAAAEPAATLRPLAAGPGEHQPTLPAAMPPAQARGHASDGSPVRALRAS